jgi:hypothetical protein
MGKTQIIEKLSKKLESAPKSEEDIIYVLSRIRKILEINNHPEKYSTLNFYCNLALHSKIDRCPYKITSMLQRVCEGTDYSNSIINFMDFHRQLHAFIVDYELPDFYENYDIKTFNKILNEIYSDTPIIIESTNKLEIIINNNGSISGKSSS